MVSGDWGYLESRNCQKGNGVVHLYYSSARLGGTVYGVVIAKSDRPYGLDSEMVQRRQKPRFLGVMFTEEEKARSVFDEIHSLDDMLKYEARVSNGAKPRQAGVVRMP